MVHKLDPRGDLPLPNLDPRTYLSRSADTFREHRRRSAQAVGATQKRKHQHHRTCYDWIFSTASNVHIAMDHTSFKTYTPFKSHVLALADQRQVPVLGIGTVILNIRRQPGGSKDSHTVILDDVLHVPSWMCNVFSDIYFEPATAYEHTWTDFGVTFMKKQDDGTSRHWGFTEDFCGLERLVLAKEQCGRSPMLEDKDREVFAVNVTWPQGQRDRYEAYLLDEGQKQSRMEAKLKEIDGNTVRRSTLVERNGKV